MSAVEVPHVLIVGGGFAGVACAKGLAGEDDIRVTLFDANGVHQFQPLLYQVATAELTPEDVAFDLTKVFEKQENVEVRTAEVTSVDPLKHAVTLADGTTVIGDVLVMSAGAQANFFNVPGAAEFSYPLYSLTDAKRVRSRVLQLFADVAEHPELIDEGALTFVVVGAGATGVEIAGALAELAHDVMPVLYADVDVSAARVIVVDRGNEPLGAFSEAAHAYAAKQLDHRGVELMLGSGVTEVAVDHVKLSGDVTIGTHLTVWGGGEMAASVVGSSGLPIGRGGRVTIQPDLTVEGFPGVYALGDAANVEDADGEPLPQLGSVAQQSGQWAAGNILADLTEHERTPFHYHDKGIMAMIGRRAAVAEIGEHRHELHGRIAFAAWLGVHAALLSNIGAEMHAFMAWAEDFYVRPHHRSAELLDPSKINTPRIQWVESKQPKGK
jgi:NADH:ubiquinone reductase (H+-translocating)